MIIQTSWKQMRILRTSIPAERTRALLPRWRPTTVDSCKHCKRQQWLLRIHSTLALRRLGIIWKLSRRATPTIPMRSTFLSMRLRGTAMRHPMARGNLERSGPSECSCRYILILRNTFISLHLNKWTRSMDLNFDKHYSKYKLE